MCPGPICAKEFAPKWRYLAPGHSNACHNDAAGILYFEFHSLSKRQMYLFRSGIILVQFRSKT